LLNDDYFAKVSEGLALKLWNWRQNQLCPTTSL